MTSAFNPIVISFDVVDSTNTIAQKHARRGATEGLCIVAKEQTCGRGRKGNWVSPPEAGLYMSMVLRPGFRYELWPLVSLSASLAIHSVLKMYSIKADLKWPNDVEIEEKKVCGILAEAIDMTKERSLIVGIGLNLKNHPLLSELNATAVELHTTASIDKESLLRVLIDKVYENYLLLYTNSGVSQITKEWSENSSYAKGKLVRVTTGSEVFDGITRGLDEFGALIVETEGGVVKSILAGEIYSLRRAI
jgi:BirA family transcriptional regulator, biotin operon repressor / biotin---[acetyl-CoA-carboxylase] ligase